MSDDRGKRSWSEIDRARIRGIKLENKASKAEVREQKVAASAAKKKLESLFSRSKVSKEKSDRLEIIKSARGKPEFYEHLTSYFKDFGCPLEFEVQMLFLDHRDKAILLDLLSELKNRAPKFDLSQQDLLHSKLKVMALATFDPVLSRAISDVQKVMLRV